jgi:hypothetical protein
MSFKIAIGCIDEWKNKLVLRKRAIEELRSESAHKCELDEINSQINELDHAIYILSNSKHVV